MLSLLGENGTDKGEYIDFIFTIKVDLGPAIHYFLEVYVPMSFGNTRLLPIKLTLKLVIKNQKKLMK